MTFILHSLSKEYMSAYWLTCNACLYGCMINQCMLLCFVLLLFILKTLWWVHVGQQWYPKEWLVWLACHHISWRSIYTPSILFSLSPGSLECHILVRVLSSHPVCPTVASCLPIWLAGGATCTNRLWPLVKDSRLITECVIYSKQSIFWLPVLQS